MIKFDKKDAQRFTVSSIGAVTLSAACVFAAIAPAKAATPATPLSVSAWQHKVENRIESFHEARDTYQPSDTAVSQVAVQLNADGTMADARVARSSGSRQIDKRAITVARGLRYPALPEGFRKGGALVRMNLYFGPDAEAKALRDQQKEATMQLAAL